MPVFPFKCSRCGHVEDRFYPSYRAMCAEVPVRCLVDNGLMERLPSAPAFTVSGYSYANGYSGEKS